MQMKAYISTIKQKSKIMWYDPQFKLHGTQKAKSYAKHFSFNSYIPILVTIPIFNISVPK